MINLNAGWYFVRRCPLLTQIISWNLGDDNNVVGIHVMHALNSTNSGWILCVSYPWRNFSSAFIYCPFINKLPQLLWPNWNLIILHYRNKQILIGNPIKSFNRKLHFAQNSMTHFQFCVFVQAVGAIKSKSIVALHIIAINHSGNGRN